jgi:hypothetical protein
LAGGRLLFELPVPAWPEEIARVAISANGKAIAFVCVEGRRFAVEVWDVMSGKRSRRLPDWNGSVDAVAFSADGNYLATASVLEPLRDPEGRSSPSAVAARSEVQLWSLAKAGPANRFPAQAGSIRSLAFSADSRRLASGSTDSTTLVWELTAFGEKQGRQP